MDLSFLVSIYSETDAIHTRKLFDLHSSCFVSNFHLSFSYFIGNSGRSSMHHSTANASEARRVV